ncbi:MAG: TraR/DksA C4-type zinc finger protein [Actinomycetota bacterium]|nr:TraR/DksA C4-type zinc finger protein [Actinomycetota bacterium]
MSQSQIDTEKFRDALLRERQKVAEAIQYLHDENPGSLEDETEETMSVDNHPADVATATVDREIDYTLEENSEHVLRAIDEALERIEAGTFGICSNCGKPIEPERLELLPYATLCIECKRLEERG